MAENSAIEWTDHTFNPWSGCTKVHAGCANCYAEKNYSVRMRGVKWGPGGTRVVAADAGWQKPLKWNREAEKFGVRARVFAASLADVFEDWDGPMLDAKGVELKVCDDCLVIQPDGWKCMRCGRSTTARDAKMEDVRRRLFALIDATPWLDWIIPTKRPQNVPRMWCSHVNTDGAPPSQLHRKNVWLLTSVSDQETADRMIPELLKCRRLVPVLGISAEPLLGPIDLSKYLGPFCPACEMPCFVSGCRSRCCDAIVSRLLNWVIVGGESGRGARPMHPDWALSIRDQCGGAGVPFFFKQWGEYMPYWDEDRFTHGGEETARNAHEWMLPSGVGGKCWIYDDDGTWQNWTGDPRIDVDGQISEQVAVLSRVGKKHAGRILDSRTHDAFPQLQEA